VSSGEQRAKLPLRKYAMKELKSTAFGRNVKRPAAMPAGLFVV
jgi:hypothetical protein